jgi:hypothetical protein
MTFNAKIESINLSAKQIVVEYFDPHGGDSLRLAMAFNYDSTPEDLRQIVIDNTPHSYFYNRNEELRLIAERNINQEQLTVLIGESIEYELPSYDNEEV